MTENLIGDVMLWTKPMEGFCRKPKPDTNGTVVIGYGTNLGPAIDMTKAELLFADGIDEQTANAVAYYDMGKAYSELSEAIPWWTGIAYSARFVILAMAYQLGVGGLMNFPKMLAAAQRGDYAEMQRQGYDSLWAKKQTPSRANALLAKLDPLVKAQQEEDVG